MVQTSRVLAMVRDEARRRKVRWTTQRQVIVERFLAADGHLTMEELHARVRRADPEVSSATVYRTLNLLVEIGVAQKSCFVGGRAAFERVLGKAHHDHLVCLSCGAITEFHQDLIEDLQQEVARKHGFRLLHHRLDLLGQCAACQRAGRSLPDLSQVRQADPGMAEDQA